jgi:hypothetical protein
MGALRHEVLELVQHGRVDVLQQLLDVAVAAAVDLLDDHNVVVHGRRRHHVDLRRHVFGGHPVVCG